MNLFLFFFFSFFLFLSFYLFIYLFIFIFLRTVFHLLRLGASTCMRMRVCESVGLLHGNEKTIIESKLKIPPVTAQVMRKLLRKPRLYRMCIWQTDRQRDRERQRERERERDEYMHSRTFMYTDISRYIHVNIHTNARTHIIETYIFAYPYSYQWFASLPCSPLYHAERPYN